jgi:hypothetical protein
MATVPIQNFIVPRGNDEEIFVNVIPSSVGESLMNSIVVWRAYTMVLGVPQTQLPPVIEKSTGSGITNLPSPPMTFEILINAADTINLQYGNYYHEAEINDEIHDHVTVLNGVMTITLTGD